jgi:hypothetical protein
LPLAWNTCTDYALYTGKASILSNLAQVDTVAMLIYGCQLNFLLFEIKRDLKPANILLADIRKAKSGHRVEAIGDTVLECFENGQYVAKVRFTKSNLERVMCMTNKLYGYHFR